MLEVGSQPIPGHRLTQRLGAGVFGEVWEAHDPDGRFVALRFMDRSAASSPLIQNDLRKLRTLGEVRHPYFVQVYGVHSTDQHIVLSMERADGNLEDLRQVYLEETGKNIPIDHLLELLEQAAEGLDFLAELKLPGFDPCASGLQHGDIRPSNLLLLGDCVKIADFGLCAGTNWRGIPPYAAPELSKGQAAIGTDQFALCITFLHLCAGERPFWNTPPEDESPTGLPIDLTKLRERELPLIVRALHPRADSRWPSCLAFIQALREISQSSRPPLSLRPRNLRPTLQTAGHR